jgi:hypothetical protein
MLGHLRRSSAVLRRLPVASFAAHDPASFSEWVPFPFTQSPLGTVHFFSVPFLGNHMCSLLVSWSLHFCCKIALSACANLYGCLTASISIPWQDTFLISDESETFVVTDIAHFSKLCRLH